MKKMNTIIVDDEVNSRNTLALLLEQYCPNVALVGTAENMQEARQLLSQENIDLAFLDVQIGTRTIFELLTQLPKIDFEVIFVSAYENYAVKAVKFTAIDYLLKPVEVPLLQDAVQRAIENVQKKNTRQQLDALLMNMQQRNNNKHYVALATSDAYELVQVEDILYCAAEGSYTRFFLKKEEELFVSRNLKYYERLLDEYRFFRTHSSCLINLNHLKRIIRTDGGLVEMKNGKKLPLSRNKKDDLIKALQIRA